MTHTFSTGGLAVPVLSDTGRTILAMFHTLPSNSLDQKQQDVLSSVRQTQRRVNS